MSSASTFYELCYNLLEKDDIKGSKNIIISKNDGLQQASYHMRYFLSHLNYKSSPIKDW